MFGFYDYVQPNPIQRGMIADLIPVAFSGSDCEEAVSAAFSIYCAVDDAERVSLFLYAAETEVGGKVFGRLLRECWLRGKNGSILGVLGKRFICHQFAIAEKAAVMTAEEMAVYDALPDIITAWRGVAENAGFQGTLWHELDNRQRAGCMVCQARKPRSHAATSANPQARCSGLLRS